MLQSRYRGLILRSTYFFFFSEVNESIFELQDSILRVDLAVSALAHLPTINQAIRTYEATTVTWLGSKHYPSSRCKCAGESALLRLMLHLSL